MQKISSFADKKTNTKLLAALKVARILSSNKFDAYLIGGAVRDIFLGITPKDFDIVTNATPEQILKLAGFKRSMYKDTAQAFGITRLLVDVSTRSEKASAEVEVATYRQDIEAHLGRKFTKVKFSSLEDDINRRDLTINALALDLVNDFLVDLVGGVDDLKTKTVKFIGEPLARIKEDPLRILRAIRLKNQLGFNYTEETSHAISEAVIAGYVDKIAMERVREELAKMLVHKSRVRALEDLDNFGVIEVLIPELASAKGVSQPSKYHLEGDVWTHTLMAMEHLSAQPSVELAWGVLLHDIGKPPTYKPVSDTGDRIRFDKHYEVGADIAAKILSRLKFSKKQIDYIKWMINFHMGIDDLPKMRAGRAQQFMSHPAFSDLLLLHKADAAASIRKTDGKIDHAPPDFSHLEAIWEKFKSTKTKSSPSLKKDLGIDGKWLMDNLHLQEGKQLGKILDKLENAYLDGEIKNASDAKKYASKLIAN